VLRGPRSTITYSVRGITAWPTGPRLTSFSFTLIVPAANSLTRPERIR
jgi:hypothetical protein